MKAAIYTQYGPPEEVIKVSDIEKPQAKNNEVLIKVYASTVNRTDCGFLRAKPPIVRLFSGLFKPKATVLGNEFAGEVVSIGKNVDQYKIGDRVFGFDDVKFGGHAEYMVLPESAAMTKIPENLSFKEAAPGCEGAHYSLFYIRAAKIDSSKKVLINGATGAIGSAGLQISKQLGAYVTATCNTKNIELIKSLGADKIINYEKEDFAKDNETYDVIFDSVGKSTFKKCSPLLKKGGIYMSSELGPNAQNPFLAIWTSLFGSKKVMFPIPKTSKEDIEYISQLMEKGIFKPVIDRSYNLDSIIDAFKYVEKGEKIGNVVIEIN